MLKQSTRIVSLTLFAPRLPLHRHLQTMSDLSYLPERATELKENIDGVLAEVRAAGTDKVSLLANTLRCAPAPK